MVELARDGTDLGSGILQCAKEDWEKTGRAGEVPPDAYIEGPRRQAHADLEKAIKKRNRGWSGLSIKPVGILAVVKRAWSLTCTDSYNLLYAIVSLGEGARR